MDKTILYGKFKSLIDNLTEEDLKNLSVHIDGINGALYRFLVNAYRAEKESWVLSAKDTLLGYDFEGDFAQDHAQELWNSVTFRLTTESAESAVESELSYWSD